MKQAKAYLDVNVLGHGKIIAIYRESKLAYN